VKWAQGCRSGNAATNVEFSENADMMRVCFMEAQFHPELRDRIQSEVIGK